MIIVGIIAPKSKYNGLTPLLKKRLSIDCPAGFGALAITVSPPPVTAPATTAYFEMQENQVQERSTRPAGHRELLTHQGKSQPVSAP